jgi:Na+-driven multidrug efflux pump
MQRDLTRGPIGRNLLAMSVPAMIGMLGQTLYDVIDHPCLPGDAVWKAV